MIIFNKYLKRGSFLLLIIVSALSAEEKQPNFLFISIDDLNNYVSFLQHTEGNFIQKIYQDEAVREDVASRLTPNLDRLAGQSMVFSQTYCSQALCGPSRTAMLTGVPPHVSGYHDHHVHFRHHESLAKVVTLPQYLKENGYFTAGVGKIFHKAAVNFQNGVQNDWPDRLYSWSHWIDRPIGVHTDGKNETRYSPYNPVDPHMKFGVTAYDVEDTHDYTNAKFIADVLSEGTSTIKDNRRQVHELRLPEGRPFFLACGIFAPHMPWSVPQQFYDRFPVEEMTVDQNLRDWTEEDIEDLPDYAIRKFVKKDVPMLDATGEKVHGVGKGHLESWRAAIQAYLATIAYADECLGLLVDAIEKSPYSDNTVVILHSDHGWHLGNKFRYRKHALWDPANHSVLLVRDPNAELSLTGTECGQMVSLQDVYPYVANRAGLAVPKHVHGRDFSQLLNNPESEHWENLVVRSYGTGNYSVRTDRYHYLRYEDGSSELYDIVNDPWEFDNLSGRPEHESLRTEMNQLLDERLSWTAGNYRHQ